MATEHVLEDKELGRLLVRVNVRARRLTFRTREDVIHVTVPPGTTIGEVKNAVEQLRPRLRAARQQQSRPLIDLDYRIDTEFFKLSLVGGERDRFLSRSELGEMQIICPPDADFSNKELQAWLRKVIEEALRRNAKIILPPRLLVQAMRIALFECENKLQQRALGKLFRPWKHQSVLFPCPIAQTLDRLCAAARVGAYP